MSLHFLTLVSDAETTAKDLGDWAWGLPIYLRLGPPVMAGIVHPGRARHGPGRRYLGIPLTTPWWQVEVLHQ